MADMLSSASTENSLLTNIDVGIFVRFDFVSASGLHGQMGQCWLHFCRCFGIYARWKQKLYNFYTFSFYEMLKCG